LLLSIFVFTSYKHLTIKWLNNFIFVQIVFMTTNIITFKKSFLIEFLKYQLEHKTNLRRYYLSWLRLNVRKPPKSYYPKPSSKLESNQIVVPLPNWSYPFSGAFYLSFKKQKEFEIIVNNSFNVIIYNSLFSLHYEEEIETTLENICNKYNIDIDYMETLRIRFYRLRKKANDSKVRRK